jgi:flagella basal body P-ring formation protein FlgA
LVQAQCWQDVYFTKDRILTRKALSPYDFDTHKVDILSYGQSIVAAHIDLKDYELLHTLSAHKPLMWRDITRKPTIRKGKMVNAVGRNGLLTLSMKCEAVTNGFEGEFVTLRNLQTRKEFQGRVQNQETVEIYF